MNSNLVAAVEAILFAYGEPLELKKIAKSLGIAENEVETALTQLNKDLENQNRGLCLIFKDRRVQLATKPALVNSVEALIKDEFEENLSQASLETLSLITYLGPISRPQIDYFRGVNSTFTLRSLMMRGLIERVIDPQRANAFIYQPTFELLKHLGVSKIEDLPDYEKFRQLNV